MNIRQLFRHQYHNFWQVIKDVLGSFLGNWEDQTPQVWENITGQNIRECLAGFLLPPGRRFVRGSIRRKFVRLEKPKSPCIVLMHKFSGSAHVGLFLHGRVLHIRRAGVAFQPLELATLGFKTHRFYDVKESYSG